MEKDRIFPDNWKELVREKKVILYNTGVSSLLNGGEKHIEKMKWVFGIFQEHPEVVLWWRPHPLELSTLQSMRPELEEQYKKVHQEYIDENIGILDESMDLNRAIAISDAYYGAWSSVMQLYKLTKKPILLSNDDVMEYSSEIAFYICDFVVIDEYMWFISSFYTGLFRMNLTSLVVEDVVQIPGERIYEQGMMRYIVKIGRELFLIPDWGNKVVAYDLDHNTMRIARIGDRTTYSKFSFAYYKDNCLYLVNEGKNSCLKMNVRDFTLHMEDIEKVQVHKMQDEKEYIVIKPVDNKLYAFPYEKNVVQIIDTKTGQKITKRINIAKNLENKLSNNRLFEVYKDDSSSLANPIYAGETIWVYTLPRYIDAVAYGNNEDVTIGKDISLCGKKIYEIV